MYSIWTREYEARQERRWYIKKKHHRTVWAKWKGKSLETHIMGSNIVDPSSLHSKPSLNLKSLKLLLFYYSGSMSSSPWKKVSSSTKSIGKGPCVGLPTFGWHNFWQSPTLNRLHNKEQIARWKINCNFGVWQFGFCLLVMFIFLRQPTFWYSLVCRCYEWTLDSLEVGFHLRDTLLYCFGHWCTGGLLSTEREGLIPAKKQGNQRWHWKLKPTLVTICICWHWPADWQWNLERHKQRQ